MFIKVLFADAVLLDNDVDDRRQREGLLLELRAILAHIFCARHRSL